MLSRKVLVALCACLTWASSTDSRASNVQFVGMSTYSCFGGVGVLTADQVSNFDYYGYSGTLHLELWALPSPYSGNLTVGYKLAQHSLGQLNAGYMLYGISSGTIACTPPQNGTWYVSMILTEYTGGFINAGYATRDFVNFATPIVIGPPPPPPPPAGVKVTAVEYYYPGFDHYFITANSDEIAKLDAGVFPGWTRTGQSFHVYYDAPAGSTGVCRFFSTAFAPKSSHFYTPDATECGGVKHNASWQYEAIVFNVPVPDAAGNCAAGTVPVYRMYNNGQGAAPNHRYTTSLAVRAQMLANGWIPEGHGAVGVIMCAPT